MCKKLKNNQGHIPPMLTFESSRRGNLPLLAMFVAALVIAPPLSGMHEARATDLLSTRIARVLQNYPLMQAVQADVGSSEHQLSAEQKRWYPTVSMNMGTGYENIRRDTGTKGVFHSRHATLGVTQMLWDFGKTNAEIHRAKIVLEKERLEQEAQRQNLILAAIDATMGLIRASRVREHARASVDNINRQTNLESARKEGGRGYATDYLQARAQLSGAEARLIAAEAAFDRARNRYRAVFEEEPPSIAELGFPKVPKEMLPVTLEEAMQLTDSKNPDIRAAAGRAETVRAERDLIKKKEYMPSIKLEGELTKAFDKDGTAGDQHEGSVMVVASWDMNVGLRSRDTIRAAQKAVSSSIQRTSYVRIQAREEAENAWFDLKAAENRVRALRQQVDISEQFLDLARSERELGRRSLLDVLSGETSLINAQADAEAAEVDNHLAAVRLLRATGQLDLTAVEHMSDS